MATLGKGMKKNGSTLGKGKQTLGKGKLQAAVAREGGGEGSVSGQSQSSGRSTSQSRKRLVWKKKEVDRKAWLETNEKAPGLAKVSEEDDRPFARMLEEMKKKEKEGPPAPLEKGSNVDTKKEPLEKGTATAASSASPLEKGQEDPPAPLEKGSTVETKQELLEKGKEVTAPSEEPLEKGKEVTAPSEEPLEKGNFEVFCHQERTGNSISCLQCFTLGKGKRKCCPQRGTLEKG